MPATPPYRGATRSPCWRRWMSPPGDMALDRFQRLLYGHLCDGRDVSQMLQLDALLVGDEEEVAEIEWERVKRDPHATAEQRAEARYRHAMALRAQGGPVG